MTSLDVVLLLFGLAASFSVGAIVGAWLSWCDYQEGWRDGYRYGQRRGR